MESASSNYRSGFLESCQYSHVIFYLDCSPAESFLVQEGFQRATGVAEADDVVKVEV